VKNRKLLGGEVLYDDGQFSNLHFTPTAHAGFTCIATHIYDTLEANSFT